MSRIRSAVIRMIPPEKYAALQIQKNRIFFKKALYKLEII